MPQKSFELQIVTPEKVVLSDVVLSFTAPGTVGSFQVLYNHAPLLSSIAVGQVKVVDRAERVLYYATSGGFVEVRENKVVMLAETAERSDQIDMARAEGARERALERLAEKKGVTEVARARAALMRAINRIKIAGRA